jgi:hypothetical protein
VPADLIRIGGIICRPPLLDGALNVPAPLLLQKAAIGGLI